MKRSIISAALLAIACAGLVAGEARPVQNAAVKKEAITALRTASTPQDMVTVFGQLGAVEATGMPGISMTYPTDPLVILNPLVQLPPMAPSYDVKGLSYPYGVTAINFSYSAIPSLSCFTVYAEIYNPASGAWTRVYEKTHSSNPYPGPRISDGKIIQAFGGCALRFGAEAKLPQGMPSTPVMNDFLYQVNYLNK